MNETGNSFGLSSLLGVAPSDIAEGQHTSERKPTDKSSSNSFARDRSAELRSARSQPRHFLIQQVRAEVCARLNQSLYAQLVGNHYPVDAPAIQTVSRPWHFSVSCASPQRPETSGRLAASHPGDSQSPGTTSQPRTSRQETIAPSQQSLLILGEPGVGKTTTLLDLAARQLSLLQLEQEPISPSASIPVLFDLSTWADRRQSIPLWLQGELVAKYNISPDIARRWVQDGSIWPLLDGLDGVERIFQAACIQSIDRWLVQDSWLPQKHRRDRGDRCSALSPVICCRTAAYTELSVPLQVSAVATIERLSSHQVSSSLRSLKSSYLTPILQRNLALSELLRAPAFLCMVAAVDRHSSSLDRLFSTQHPDTYLIQMYVRSSMNRMWRYPPSLVLRLLAWVARQMEVTSCPEFEVNALHPLINLQHSSLLSQYGVGVIATFGLVGGLVGAIGGTPLGAIAAAAVYAVLGLGNVMVLGTDPFAMPRWQHPQQFTWRQLASIMLLYSPLAVLAVVCVGAFGTGLRLGLGLMLAGITWFGLSGWLVGDLGGLLTETELPEADWLRGGLGRSIKRGWLRLILWRSGRTPWNYQRFLDDCVSVNLMQKVGDRYRFIHPTIQDYFTPTQY